ncbi:MAG: hypothetical protein OSJ36_08340, partial [Odoribacter sp.]|nr:hypothetical protein [Odoribacter sp.]
ACYKHSVPKLSQRNPGVTIAKLLEKYINPLFEIADEEYRIAFFCQLVIQLLERVFFPFPLNSICG